MSRRAQFPPKPHPHAASGQERVRYRGKDFYLGPIGSDEARREYVRLLGIWTAGGAATPKPKTPTLLVVDEIWATFMVDAKETRHPKEVDAFARAGKVVCGLHGQLTPDRFDSMALIGVQKGMVSLGWTRGVVNRMIVRVRTVWRWAEARRLVPQGSWDHLRTVPGLRKNDRAARNLPPRVVPTFANVKAVARKCSRVVGRALLVQWYTGMRSKEVRMMRGDQLERSGKVWLYRLTKHKSDWREGDAGRVVALGPKCQALLRGLLAGDGFVFAPPKRGKVRKRDHYSCNTYAQHVRRAAVAAGVAGFEPYDCRHAAKQRITRLFGLDAARAMLGQASIGVTNGYGLQLDTETAARVAAKMG